jgi:hypothetical protein
MHQMKESEKESKEKSTSIEMENFPKSTGITSNPDDVVIEIPDDSGELQSVSIHSLEQALETALDTMQSKLDTLIQRNERFHAAPPKIADNKEKKKKGVLKKTAALFKADDYTHFDLSIEKRKLLTPEVIQETLQKDLDSLKSEISPHLARYSSDSSKKLEKLSRDIEKLEMFLNSSDIAMDLEVRKSKGKLTKTEVAKSLIQGKEHMRSIISRSFLQSVISAGAGSLSQIGAAYLKELAFKALINQLTVEQADDVVEDYLEGLTEASSPEVTTANTPEMISDEALTSVTNAITTSEPAKFSEDICESLLAHIESLEELPDTVDELKELANNFVKGEIDRLGNERSFSHNFIQTMKDCVDFSTEIEGIVRPDSPYYDTAELNYSTIVAGDFAIAMLKGSVVPVFDTLYERGKENRETTQISSQKKNIGKVKKFRQEALLSLKNQAKGAGATLALVFVIKAVAGQLTFDGVGKDVTFNALQVATNGCIDGVRSLSSCGETCSQITKATLRTLIGRGAPQVVKSYISRRNEFGDTGIAVTTDLAGVLIGGALKEINGALWLKSTNNPDGNLGSWAGKAAFDERVLLKALKKRAGSNPTVLNSLKEIGKVKIRVAESDTYINQVDASLTQVISVPSVSQKPPSSGATGVTAGATNAKAGATNATAQATQLKSLKEQQQKLDTEIAKIQKSKKDPKISEEQKKSFKQQEKSLETRRTEIRQQRDILSPPTTSNTDKIVTTAEVYPTRKFDATKFKSSSITPNPNGARPKQGPKQSPKQGPKTGTTRL